MRYLPGFLLLLGSLLSHSARTQERLDMPGDNLNLYAVLKVFQESETLEAFEKALNEENSEINNLDLNGDNQVDYIRVTDEPEGDVHNIILRVALSRQEMQDVAVIVVDKDRDGQAKIQVIGDEDLYGKDYIVEPNYSSNNQSSGTPNPGYSGNANNGSNTVQYTTTYTTTYEVASWPVVSFIFLPTYRVWHSPWYWGYYPSYWRPWRPFYWHQYYTYHYYWDYWYFGHYRRWRYYRVPGWHTRYYGSAGFRRRAPMVQTRYRRGDYRVTYSRPDMANAGRDMFNRVNPKAPTVHNKLPVFDNKGRPTVTRPGNVRPTRPVTRPGGEGNAGNTRPVTRPTNPGTVRPTNPGTRPTTPVTRPSPITRPAEPGTRPTNPGTRPVNPGTRPTNPVTRPSEPGTRPTRPVTRPSPGTKPANPSTRPVTRPAPTTRPATRPSGGSQPATRPATRPSGGSQPASRPAPRPSGGQ